MNDKIRRIETSLERDLKRLPQLYDEITRIVERVHLLGIEVGAIKMAMKVSKGADDVGDKKDA